MDPDSMAFAYLRSGSGGNVASLASHPRSQFPCLALILVNQSLKPQLGRDFTLAESVWVKPLNPDPRATACSVAVSTCLPGFGGHRRSNISSYMFESPKVGGCGHVLYDPKPVHRSLLTLALGNRRSCIVRFYSIERKGRAGRKGRRCPCSPSGRQPLCGAHASALLGMASERYSAMWRRSG